MSTLTGNKISLTYKSLIKTSDNDVLTGALKELSDGLGNNSGVFLNTGGDLKSTGTLEFSNFKATAYAVTINKLVNEADGISNNDNDTSLPTSAAVKDYVDTHVTSQDLDFSDGTNPGAVDLDSQVFAIVGTSNEIETSASGQQLQIGLPNDVTISGTYTGTTFSGDLNGTINSATTAVTQTAGDNSTKVATTAYVDTLDAASDLDFSDGSVNSAVNLNTQVLSIQGTSNEITTTASGQSLTIALDTTGVDLPDGSTAITQTAGDNSTKVATTAYVDVLDAASDLDIAGDTGTGDVNLNTQTLTLQGTTNQVITAVSGQTTTFSLPSTVHRDLQGNVTGNADTATAWQTARDLSISGEATGTLSSVDGTSNISGAVTLTNSAVTGKVLTGLPTPAASTVQASDSILEGIGKLQSQINGIANGLQFQGTWDAATNTPTLNSGGGEVDSGTTTGQTADKLIDSSQNFLTTVSVGDKVINQVDGQSASVTNVDSNTSLTLDADIMLSGEAYTIDASPFLVQGHYYVVSVGGTTSLNGNANWAIGDWVIAGADNIWSKLDHTQIDGQGTPGNLPVWNTATTLTDSIVSESGTALTVTGSLSTTLGASVTGDFAVNTNKFTVNATSGNTVVAGSLTANSLTIDDITINGSTISDAGDFTIDVGGDISLDSANGTFRLKDAGTEFGKITENSNNLRIYSSISDGDILLQGNDGGSTVTALTLDMSEGGNATFAGSVNAQDMRLQASGTTYLNIGNDTTGSASSDGASIGYFTGQSSLQIVQRENDAMVFSTNANERMRIDSSGNVSIGTVTPLYLVGTSDIAQISVNRVGTTGAITNTSRSAAYINLNGADGGSSIEFNTASGNNTQPTEKMVIDSAGNVGIGTDTADQTGYGYKTLTVMGGTGAGDSGVLELLAPSVNAENQNYGIVSFGAGGTRTAMISANRQSTNDAGNLRFWTSPNSGGIEERMRIDRVGNVGINVDPSTQIHNLQKTNDRAGGFYTQLNGNNYGLSMFVNSGGYGIIGSNGTFTTDIITLDLNSGNATFVSEISSSDDININNGKLVVNHTSAEVRIKSSSDTGESYINFSDPSDINPGQIYYGHTDNSMRFRTNDTERMRIDSSGHIYQGTIGEAANKYYYFQNSTTADAGLVFKDNASTTSGYLTYNHGQDAMKFGVNGSERMRITSGGDVEIQGGDIFLNSGTNYNDKGVVYLSNERTAIISDIVNNTANGDTSLDFQTRKGGTRASAMFINEFRNVMIGTTTQAPSAQLTIALDDSVGGRLSLSNLRTALFDGDEFGRLSFVSNDATQTGDRARISAVCRNTSAATDLVFYTGNTSASVAERMRLTSGGDLHVNSGIYGNLYTQTSSDATFSIIDTGLGLSAGVYELFYMGNANDGGSSVYRSVTTGLIIVSVDFSHPNVVNEIRFVQTSITGGGSSDINLVVTVKILQGGSEYDLLNYSTSGQTIRVKISGWAGNKGSDGQLRLTKRL